MKQVGGVWLPDHEQHLVGWMKGANHVVDGKLTYQYKKFEAAMRYVKNWRTAVDVGAHCGLWSMHLMKKFDIVHAFEPVAAHLECFAANLMLSGSDDGCGDGRVNLHPCALGEKDGMISIHTAFTSSGDSWVDGAGHIPMHRLDDFALKNVDLIKLDCEGYELFALRGGEEMLKRCQPAVIVEQKPGRAQKFGLPETGAVEYLKSLGAKLRQEMSGDYIMSWGEP